MNWLSDKVLGHRRKILILAAVLSLAGALAMTQVSINYNLSDYLPARAPSTIALDTLYESSDGIPNLQVYVPDISLADAARAKDTLLAIPHVTSVLWLDDVADPLIPLAMQDAQTVAGFYKDGAALYQATVDIAHCAAVTLAVRDAFPGCRLSGEAASQATVQTASMAEIADIMLLAIPIAIIILLLCTGSWLEPFLFIATIGVAILLNEGTNVFLGEVSYVTQACSAILQLAVSFDYAVFLLHRFTEFRREGEEAQLAMKHAMRASVSSITASAMTTIFGFLALMLMDFRMGADMGVVLAKGVTLSFLSVMIFLPALAIGCTKLLDKTTHRPFLPSFKRFSRAVVRFGAPIAVVLLIALVPAYIAQNQNAFVYGSSGMHAEDSPIRVEAREIEQVFGGQQQLLLLVPEGDPVREKNLTAALAALPGITTAVSYANQVGAEIPDIILSPAQLSQLRAGGYSRIVLYSDLQDEGEDAFSLVVAIRALAAEQYGESAHLVGQMAVNYDLMKTITGDNLKVLLGAIVAIGLVLLVTFRSVSIPVILLLTIEGAIWLNMALPYFMGDSMNYIGYQIISAVQLGATVDYGILLANRYMELRRTLCKRDAVRSAVQLTTGSILAPALILICAGTILAMISSNGVISQMGAILARGTAVSSLMVLLLLPTLLIALDGVIMKTTLRGKASGKEGNAHA